MMIATNVWNESRENCEKLVNWLIDGNVEDSINGFAVYTRWCDYEGATLSSVMAVSESPLDDDVENELVGSIESYIYAFMPHINYRQ